MVRAKKKFLDKRAAQTYQLAYTEGAGGSGGGGPPPPPPPSRSPPSPCSSPPSLPVPLVERPPGLRAARRWRLAADGEGGGLMAQGRG